MPYAKYYFLISALIEKILLLDLITFTVTLYYTFINSIKVLSNLIIKRAR